MAAELEDLRERVERVEELLGTVESRMGGVDAILEILCAGPMAARLDDALRSAAPCIAQLGS